MVRRLALCLVPAMALALAACSGNSSGSTGSNGGTGQGTGSTTSTSTGAGSTTGLGGTTGIHPSSTSSNGSSGSNGTTGASGSTGSSAGIADVCAYCAQNADCASGICDSANHQCQVTDCLADGGGSADSCFNGCNTDGSCSCDPLTALCGECFDDTECVSGHCDPNQNGGFGACVTATCAGGSDADSQSCTGAGGTCQGGTCACPIPPHELCEYCAQNSDCTSGICDTANHQCQVSDCYADGGGSADSCFFNGCNADGSCACDPLTAVCGECSDDSECVTGHCDQNSGFCTPATCAGGSDADSQACTGAGGTCQGGACACPLPPRDVCDGCSQDSDCASGHCVGATANSLGQCQVTDCLADGGESGTDQACLNSGSFEAQNECNPNGSCNCYPLGTLCDPNGFCLEDFDCAGGRCDQNNFVCTATCSSSTDCSAASGATCDTTAGTCACPPPPAELCQDCTSTPCDTGLTCDPTSHICQTTTCYADGGGSSDDCFFASSSGTCNPDGSCICD